MKSELRAAFERVNYGYSPDRVVADPDLNGVFLEECRRLGLAGSSADLNRALLNLRKQGGLRGLKSKRSSFPNEDQYRFAAEIAARFLERRDGLSLDAIISDPAHALEFDELAARIAPGYGPVDYRWAALNLRKSRRLKPEIIGRALPAEEIRLWEIRDIDLSKLPDRQGLYVFLSSKDALYVGEAENLQNRIRKHLDHSDNRGLARWLWQEGGDAMHIEVHVLAATISTRVRRALEMELIRSRDPVFNIKR
jgi:GIY-YIG catalytic domain-containing protein